MPVASNAPARACACARAARVYCYVAPEQGRRPRPRRRDPGAAFGIAPPADGEYYWVDLEEVLRVVNLEGANFGSTVSHLFSTGANCVLVARRARADDPVRAAGFHPQRGLRRRRGHGRLGRLLRRRCRCASTSSASCRIRRPVRRARRGLACRRALLSIHGWKPRDFAEGNYRRVDDRPFGGGPNPGDVIERCAPPCARRGRPIRPRHAIYLSPQGRRLDQARVRELGRPCRA